MALNDRLINDASMSWWSSELKFHQQRLKAKKKKEKTQV